MDVAPRLWLCGLVAGCSYLAVDYESSFAFTRPIQTAFVGFLLLGVLLVSLHVFAPHTFPPRHSTFDYEEIPLAEPHPRYAGKADSPLALRFPTHVRSRYPSFEQLRPLATLAVLVAGLVFRVEVTRRILGEIQCAGFDWTTLVPIAIVVIQALGARPSNPSDEKLSRKDKPSSRSERERWRHSLPFILISWGLISCASALAAPRSTFICPVALSLRRTVPLWQLLNSVLDIIILLSIFSLIHGDTGGKLSLLPRYPVMIGIACIISAIVLLIIGIVIFFAMPEHRQWIGHLPGWYVLDSSKLVITFAFTCLCAIQVFARYGSKILMSVLAFASTNAAMFRVGWYDRARIPPPSPVGVIFSLLMLGAGLAWTVHIERSTSKSRRDRVAGPKLMLTCITVAVALQSVLFMTIPDPDSARHPIDDLIQAADAQHAEWLAAASASTDVSMAAKTYRQRYGRDPPPRFDKWWRYCELQAPLIVDDFDSIHQDLLPFWSVSPKELRERTWEAIANPANMVSGISIRNGRLTKSPYTPEDHRWMIEGILNMMRPFARWLPDMDLAINLNDEPRVAIPWRDLQSMLAAAGRNTTSTLQVDDEDDFTPNANRDWKKIELAAIEESRFRDETFRPSFYTYGSVGCPPSSLARKDRHWKWHEHCSACEAPHKTGQFISNFTQAGEICHQPDLADLHGFYIAPATFRTTHELMPIFSQSKAGPYQDILYPSPWNFEEIAQYLPNEKMPDYEWIEKEPVLFWRGSTSEGYGTSTGTWKGMTRQRMVHMFNNATKSEKATILLPESKAEDASYSYRAMEPQDLHEHLPTSIRIADHIERCAGRDCDEQMSEFQPQLVPFAEFQSHWKYKYLIDADGAGFSGRFIPFLQSKSLPFKTSLFREWWQSRITAWKHFVPLDVRLKETWSVLAYFHGWREGPGTKKGQEKWLMAPHEQEGEQIAMAGREWAEQVLRKEDMEIYFFRLLLEWGRLTDDRRDRLGYRDDL